MSRRRIALALLFDPATTASIDELRRDVGAEDPERIPPHITLVPPLDLLPEQLDDLWTSVVDTASRSPSLHLDLGPIATFAPRTMTIHLAVGGEVDALARLQDAVRVAPLPTRQRWPFVPHVTLVQDAPPESIERARAELSGVHFSVVVDAICLLEHQPRPGGGRNWWRPIATAPLAHRSEAESS